MARSPSSQETVKSLGAEPFNATLEDTEALKSAASQCDGVIHLAFVHDFEDFEKSTRIDQAAIGALAEGLAAGPGGAKGKPLVIASGTMMLPKGEPATEDAKAEEQLPWSLRAKSADLVYDLSRDTGIRGSVMRLPPTVHGAGDKGMIPMIVGALKEKAGYVAIIGDGSVRWPTVHRSDAAVLFRLAVEKGTGGATYHAVAEGAVPMKDIMAVAGKKTGVPVEKKTVEELMSAIGMLGGKSYRR